MGNFTVVLPVKDPDSGLLHTVDSILCSDLLPTEILIINDNSKRGCDIFDEVDKYDLVRVVLNKLTPGISGALNTGLEETVTQYVARIDSGDTVNADRFSKQLNALKNHENCKLVVSSATVIDINYKKSKYIIKAYLHTIGDFIGPFSRLPHPTWMFRKKSILIPYDERFLRCEDYGFLVQNFIEGDVKIIEEPLINYIADKTYLNFYNELSATYWKLYIVLRYIKGHRSLKVFYGFSFFIIRLLRLIVTRKKIITLAKNTN